MEDGVIIGTPGYHGGISGLIKNALDYAEDMSGDSPPYLAGKPVGCIVTAAGWQGCGTTLGALRNVVHALRGWPTPLGVAINTIETRFAPDGSCSDEKARMQLQALAREVVWFVRRATPLAACA